MEKENRSSTNKSKPSKRIYRSCTYHTCSLALMLVCVLALLSPAAMATNSTLNITLLETATLRTVANSVFGELTNGTSSSLVSMQPLLLNGSFVITNVGNETLSDINITIANAEAIVGYADVLEQPIYGNAYNHVRNEDELYLQIPELWSNDTVKFNVTYNDTLAVYPLDIDITYDKEKVLTNASINTTVTVRNTVKSEVEITNLTFIQAPMAQTTPDSNTTYFVYSSPSTSDGSPFRLYNVTDSNLVMASYIEWNMTNNTMGPGNITSLSFSAKAPTNVNLTSNESNWGAYMRLGNISATFNINASISNLTIARVEASGPGRLTVEKRRYNSTHWSATTSFTNLADAIDINLTRVDVSATNLTPGLNPGNSSHQIPGSAATYTPGQNLSNGSSWTSTSLLFEFEDTPVIWADATHIVLDDGRQINRIRSSTDNDNGYMVVQEVYVLNGYILQATKRVTPSDVRDEVFNVSIVIENVGNAPTPDLVTIFDIIPPNFYVVNRATKVHTGARTIIDGTTVNITPSVLLRGVTNSGNISNSDYAGYWGFNVDLYPMSGGSNGDGMFNSTPSNAEFHIQYMVEGTGPLSLMRNVYIVGVDPQRIVGAYSSREVTSAFNMTSKATESMVVVSTLVMTALLAGVVFQNMRKPKIPMP